MTSCPWLNENGFTCEGARRFVDHHVLPSAMNAAGAVEDALEDLREEVRAKPVKALAIAGLAGFVLAMTITASPPLMRISTRYLLWLSFSAMNRIVSQFRVSEVPD